MVSGDLVYVNNLIWNDTRMKMCCVNFIANEKKTGFGLIVVVVVAQEILIAPH